MKMKCCSRLSTGKGSGDRSGERVPSGGRVYPLRAQSTPTCPDRGFKEKSIQNHAKLDRMKELGGKTGVLVGLDLPSAGGETEAGV